MNNNLNSFLKTILNLIFKKQISVSIPFDGPPVQEKESIPPVPSNVNLHVQIVDWASPTSMVSKHFSVAEAITLHSWNRLANETDGLTDQVKAEIVKLCKIMDEVRENVLNCPINVHCIFRSVAYNQQVLHSIPHDVHSIGMAIDLDCSPHLTIEQAKEKLRPVLEKYDIRMEGGTTTWIHLDTHTVGPSGREFKA